MKRYLILIIIPLLLTTLVACQKTTTSEQKDEPADISSNTQQKTNTQDDLHNKVINGDYYIIGSDTREEKGKEWAKLWLDTIYQDNDITNVEIKYIHGGYLDAFMTDCSTLSSIYSIQFSSQQGVRDAQHLNGDNYSLEVMVVTVVDNGKTVLSGFLGPNEFDVYDARQAIYNVVQNDPRYNPMLISFPETILPQEITQIDMRLIAHDNQILRTNTLPGGFVVAVCGEPIDDRGKYALKALIFDPINNKIVSSRDIGEYYLLNTSVSQEKVDISAQKESSSKIEMFRVDAVGDITTEDCPADTLYFKYSPDKSKYVYSEKGSLYVVDENEGNTPRLLISGNDSGGQDRNYYYPFAWVDNALLVYGIGGYEWSNGCGVIDIRTGKDILLKQAGSNAQPIELVNNKLYTVIGEMGEPLDPGVIDLDQTGYPYKKLINETYDIQNIGFTDYSISPDGSKIAFIKTGYEQNEYNKIYLFSTVDGSLLKSFEFQNVFNSPQYLDFFEEDRIAIYAEQHCYCPEYMYIVNLRN
ncbi:hypothetical protein LPY66_02420 [Dehalobacter sp. DCM]|uniref:hypothetical protein n=1 Tax=Dehalobacter sp. DCM TaxID=2907827 RepID=UPI003081F6D6|nr:hypothetical protein LPY66_02420 [Dehalobacter sp. DCM]